jgi:hypothetical protein
MDLDIDDDLLAARVSPCLSSLGKSEGELRALKNQLIGDWYRKQEFIAGEGIGQLLDIIMTNCNEGDVSSLQHSIAALASVALCKEATTILFNLGVCQVIRHVISLPESSTEIVVSALRTLQSILDTSIVEIDFPRTEICRLAQLGHEKITRLSLLILSKIHWAKSNQQNRDLLYYIVSCLKACPTDVLPYIEFFRSQICSQPDSCISIFPVETFLGFLTHRDVSVRLKTIQCIAAAPSSYNHHITVFGKIQEMCLLTLERYFEICPMILPEQCMDFASLLKQRPSFASQAYPAIPRITRLPLTAPVLDILCALSAGIEKNRVEIAARIGFTSLLSCLIANENEIRQYV